jgi:hypothetical protein
MALSNERSEIIFKIKTIKTPNNNGSVGRDRSTVSPGINSFKGMERGVRNTMIRRSLSRARKAKSKISKRTGTRLK